MNTLEQKCAILAQTPQSRWFDLRFKPIIQLLNNMMSSGEIKGMANVPSPVFNMLNIHVMAFKYSGKYYVLFIDKKDNVYDCFHLETLDSRYEQFSNTLAGNIILSSDDDPKQEVYIASLALTMGAKGNQDFIAKLKTILGE